MSARRCPRPPGVVRYEIFSSMFGHSFGMIEAASPEEAISICIRDFGHIANSHGETVDGCKHLLVATAVDDWKTQNPS